MREPAQYYTKTNAMRMADTLGSGQTGVCEHDERAQAQARKGSEKGLGVTEALEKWRKKYQLPW